MSDLFNPHHLAHDERVWRADHTGEDWRLTLTPHTEDELTEPAERSFWPLQLLVVALLLIFVGRLLQLQVAVGAQYKDLSAGNSLRAIRTPADRGLIFDHTGQILARNTKRASLSVRVELLPDSLAERATIYDRVGTIIPFPDESWKKIEELRGTVVGDYVVTTELTKEQLLLLKELAHAQPAIIVAEQAIRDYRATTGLSHLIGYTGQVDEEDVARGYHNLDIIGQAGLEQTYENELRGIFGIQEVEVDARGQIGRTVSSDNNRQAVGGTSLRLGLDATFQQGVAEALTRAIKTRNEEFGDTPTLGATVVALDPRTGIIRALVSLPSYDNNLFARGLTKPELDALYSDPGKPLFNRATNGTYPPGSTLKPLIAAGALYYDLVSPSYTIDTPSAIQIGEFTFPDWKDHGVTNIQTAIAESNNIFFYALGGGWQTISGLGLERIRQTLHWFGLESPTGIDIGPEATGFVLSEEWKRKQKDEPVYLGDIYHLAIGQGDIGVTPLQLSMATAAIANGGTVFEPRAVETLVDTANQPIEEVTPPVKSRLPVSAADLQLVREGMRQAVLAGSSRPLNTLSRPLAGKTGTAQFGREDRTHAWFTGFGPFDNPEIVITVLIEGGGGSFEAAVPLAEELFRLYFNEPKPAPAGDSNQPTDAPSE